MITRPVIAASGSPPPREFAIKIRLGFSTVKLCLSLDSSLLVVSPRVGDDRVTAVELQHHGLLHRKHSRQQTMEVQEMLFPHVAHLPIDMLGRQIVVGGRQGQPFSTSALGKGFRIP
jgi:hypothetical protein